MKKRHSETRVIAYVRVSTEEQSLGPEAQVAAITNWCHQHGATLIGTYSDIGVSGAAPLEKRQGLLAALDALKKERAGVLLVAKRDRVARDVLLSAMIERLVERSGATINAVDGAGNGVSAEAQLMRHMISAFAEYERAIIRGRTRAALAVKKSRGERVGHAPFGYQVAADGKHLEVNEDEQRVIGEILDLRKSGFTVAEIVNNLNARGAKARGARWHCTTIRRLLARGAAEEGLAGAGGAAA